MDKIIVEIYRDYEIYTTKFKGKDWYLSSLDSTKSSNIESVRLKIDTHRATPTYGVYNLHYGFGRKPGAMTYPQVSNGIIVGYRQFKYLDRNTYPLHESHHQLTIL